MTATTEGMERCPRSSPIPSFTHAASVCDDMSSPSASHCSGTTYLSPSSICVTRGPSVSPAAAAEDREELLAASVPACSQHTSASVSIRQHTSVPASSGGIPPVRACSQHTSQHPSASVSIRQHTSVPASSGGIPPVRACSQHTSQHPSASVSIRQHICGSRADTASSGGMLAAVASSLSCITLHYVSAVLRGYRLERRYAGSLSCITY